MRLIDLIKDLGLEIRIKPNRDGYEVHVLDNGAGVHHVKVISGLEVRNKTDDEIEDIIIKELYRASAVVANKRKEWDDLKKKGEKRRENYAKRREFFTDGEEVKWGRGM